ncbi:hypothetical protein BOX15_Mlig029993g1, partial [Macrostomum lignano]
EGSYEVGSEFESDSNSNCSSGSGRRERRSKRRRGGGGGGAGGASGAGDASVSAADGAAFGGSNGGVASSSSAGGGSGKEAEPLYDRTELFRLEKCLLAFGYGRWPEIAARVELKKALSVDEVENLCRALVTYCLRFYTGDSRIRSFTWHLVHPDGKKETALKHSGLSTPSSRNRKTRRPGDGPPASTAAAATDEDSVSGYDQHDLALQDLDPERVLNCDSFLKHLEKACNKILHRIRLMYFLQWEIIGDHAAKIMDNADHTEIPLSIPCTDGVEKPVDWWDDEADKSLLIGIYKHGFDRYNLVRTDPCLCFASRCQPRGVGGGSGDKPATATGPTRRAGPAKPTPTALTMSSPTRKPTQKRNRKLRRKRRTLP